MSRDQEAIRLLWLKPLKNEEYGRVLYFRNYRTMVQLFFGNEVEYYFFLSNEEKKPDTFYRVSTMMVTGEI